MNSMSDSELFESAASVSSEQIASVTSSSDESEIKIAPIGFVKLKDEGNKREIKYIYHLSDIHIRNNQRHVEYNEVFERTYKKLRFQIGDDKKHSLIVVTGDIVH